MKRLGVIPARGGSKGIPGKNLADLGGRPLLAWTVRTALESGCLDRVVVSTDDPIIGAAAREAGAEVPFFRPADLARDETPTLPVIRHLVDELTTQGWSADFIALLQPTSPFRSATDIHACFDLQTRHQAAAVVSVVESEAHPAWCFTRDNDGALHPFLHAPSPSRRQELTPVFRPNGAVYVVTRQHLDSGGDFCGKGAMAYVMPPERSLDIDTPWDLHLARLIISAQPY